MSSEPSLRRVSGGDRKRESFQGGKRDDASPFSVGSRGNSHEVEERARPDSTDLGGAAFTTVSTYCSENSLGRNESISGNRGMLELDRKSLHRHPRGDGVKPTERMSRVESMSRCDNCIVNYGCIHKSADFAMQRRRRRSVGIYHPFCIFERACMCGHVCMCTSHRNHFPSGLKLSLI